MLSRSKTVLRLIEMRKIIYQKEDDLGESTDNYHVLMKEKLDNLLKDVIGVPEEARYKIDEIINKATYDEIKPKTAVVAIHEIYNDYQPANYSSETQAEPAGIEKTDLNQEITPGPALRELYKNGYR